MYKISWLAHLAPVCYSISPHFLLPIVTTLLYSSTNCWSSLSTMYRHCCFSLLLPVSPSAWSSVPPLCNSWEYTFLILFLFLTHMLCFTLTSFPGGLPSSCFGQGDSPHCVHCSLFRLHYFIEVYYLWSFPHSFIHMPQ